jgi:hypothetical protein
MADRAPREVRSPADHDHFGTARQTGRDDDPEYRIKSEREPMDEWRGRAIARRRRPREHLTIPVFDHHPLRGESEQTFALIPVNPAEL